MASRVFNKALANILLAALVTGKDVRVALLMTNTSAGTNNDGIDFVGDITTLDEMDGANYARAALTSEAAAEDDANDRGEFTASDLTWTSLGAGTRNIAGALLYQHETNDADSPVIAYFEFSSSVAADGNNFQIQWDSEGILQASQGA